MEKVKYDIMLGLFFGILIYSYVENNTFMIFLCDKFIPKNILTIFKNYQGILPYSPVLWNEFCYHIKTHVIFILRNAHCWRFITFFSFAIFNTSHGDYKCVNNVHSIANKLLQQKSTQTIILLIIYMILQYQRYCILCPCIQCILLL